MSVAEKLTAAEHFAKAEELLAYAEEFYNAHQAVPGWAARAQAHIAAAEFLLKLQELKHTTTHGGRVLVQSGLHDLQEQRSGGAFGGGR